MSVNLPPAPYSNETGKTSASVNWKPGAGNGRVVKGITIHHWGSSMTLGFDGIVDFLCSARPANPTSAHYVAQGKDPNGTVHKRVACIVDPDDIAYHAGNWTGNLTTIGIECRPNMFPEDLEVVAQLIARLRNQYGPLPLYPHSHWTSTECPGDNYRAQLTWLSNRADAILKAASTPVPTPTPTPTPTKTSSTVVLMPSTNVIYGSTLVTARTTPAVAGYHSFDFQKTDGTWSEFKRVTAVSGVSSFDWRFGGTHGVRVRFVPADPKTYAGSTSAPVTMTSVTLKP